MSKDNGTVTSPVTSLRDRIKAKHDVRREAVHVPEWEETIHVQSMTGRARDAFEERMTIQRGKSREANLANFRARIVQACAVNDDGTPLFEETDLAWLGDKNASALSRIADVAMRVSGFTREDAEELVKNSDAAPSGDSGSSSL